MTHDMTKPFDFDRWMHLAEEDPKRFEELRLQMIEQQINASSDSNRNRLRGLQFQIDARRRTAGSAMGSCIQISGMMLDHLFNDFLDALNALLDGKSETLTTSPLKNNKVIPLRKK
jgi:hypothetical protein